MTNESHDPTPSETASDRSAKQAPSEFVYGRAADALDALTRHSSDCVKLIDLDGRVLRWNAACEDLYGWTAAEMVGDVLPHIAPDKRLRAIYDIRDAAASDRVSERETTAIRSDGSHLALRSTLIPVRDAHGNTAAVLSMTRWVPDALSAGGREDDFVGVVAKQLRDPLASISGYTQLLQRPEILDDPVRRERTVRALAERARYVSSLLEDLQLVADIEEGRFVLSLGPIDLGSLVTDTVDRMEPRGARVMVDFDPGLAPAIVDRDRIAQAVSRLVDNAVRYSPDAGVVEVSVFESDGSVVIEVSAAGGEIDPEDRDQAFERGFLGAPGGNKINGLGVGLYLVRMIAEAHGGTVLYKTRPGAGATFSVRLPENGPSS